MEGFTDIIVIFVLVTRQADEYIQKEVLEMESFDDKYINDTIGLADAKVIALETIMQLIANFLIQS